MPKSELDNIGEIQRKTLITNNVFNGTAQANEYSATHTRALSDTQTPVHGKGTGIFMDTYNGGGDEDINGVPNIPGSGRIKNTVINQYVNTKGYTAPDTTNSGMVVI